MRRLLPAPRGATLAVTALLAFAGCTSVPDVIDRLDVAELRLMAETVQAALESNRVGAATNWVNPATGHLGTVTPVYTFAGDNGTPCRDYQITATADGDTAVGYDTACRRADGAWESRHYDSLSDVLRYGGNGRYAPPYPPWYDDPWCRWPQYLHDPWCRWPYHAPRYRPRSGVSFGLGVSR